MTKNDHAGLSFRYWDVQFDQGLSVAMNPHADTDEPITDLHYHSCLELSRCIDGYGVVMLSNGLYSYRAGDYLVIPAHCPHRAQSATETTSNWQTLYFNLDKERSALGRLVGKYGFRAIPLLHIRGRDVREFDKFIAHISHEFQNRPSHWKVSVEGSACVLLVELYRYMERATALPHASHEAIEVVAPALDYIAGHIHESLPIGLLARQCHLSEPHFRRVFKTHIGMAPKQYIARMRAELAQSMLRDTRQTVLEIAYACGYETLSAFNRSFKLLTGLSPMQYRKAKRQGS